VNTTISRPKEILVALIRVTSFDEFTSSEWKCFSVLRVVLRVDFGGSVMDRYLATSFTELANIFRPVAIARTVALWAACIVDNHLKPRTCERPFDRWVSVGLSRGFVAC
jgi:hypothetical protein